MDNIDYILAQEELHQLDSDMEETFNRLSLAITTGEHNDELSAESIEIVSNYIGYDISTEADDMKEFKTRVGTLYTELGNFIFKRFKKFAPMAERSAEYKSKELAKLRDDITEGVLVPDDTINEGAMVKFNSKLAVFYASGYGLKTGCSDLSTYVENIMFLPNKSGKYMNGIKEMYKQLNSVEQSLNIPRLSGLLNVKKKLNGMSETVTRKQKISDFRMSIVSKWFASNVELVMVTNSPKRGIRVHTDTFTVKTQNNKVGLANNSQTLKLLELGLRLKGNLASAHKAISFNIKIMTRDNTVQLVKSAAGEGSTHRFLVAKFSEVVTKANINMYKDLMNIDSIIIAYIRLTYKKA